ncbi:MULTISPECIES: type II secretion system secretin GspD [Sphingomonas]|uniref:Type II secretion system secretin GspD n=1 Tax=Sphingomonas albertensis TaxID=2762591 RepID=A0ABR7APZ7_9SPHN|nr:MULTISPECIES: type II secretion system secretin GspD [Sphingomonas]MBC3942521.1 type II secretion system secretin GspD [Sphingomonas albertensis]MCP8890035.1 type II secretion system secretin GspD [Sphingomonas faeni]
MKKLILGPVVALALAASVHAQTTLNVRDADIRAFIADAAKVTGRTFIIDNRVAGKVTVVTDRPLSRSEYFEVFLSTLRANGLVAVPTSNGAFRVQPLDNAASQPSRIGVAGAARNSYVTEIVRLRAIDAQSAVETVRPLVSAQGSVSANRGGNSLVVVDFADNIRRIREVLRRIDTDTSSTRVVALKNASAKEIATALQGLIGAGTGGGQGGAAATGPSASVVAVEGSNAVALRGDPTTVARLAQVAADLDQKARNGTEIRVVFLENADAEQLLPVLQELVGQTPTQPVQTALSRSNFGSSSTNGASGGQSNMSQPQIPQSGPSPSGGGGGSGQPAITAAGGKTAAVVTRFAGANAIVIAAPAEIQRQLNDVVRQLDTRREQVLVEAIVAEVSDSTARTLGAQFIVGDPSGGAFGASTFSNSAPNILQIAGAIGATQLNTSSTTTVNTDGSTTTTNTTSDAANTLQQSAISSILAATGGFGGFGGKIGSTFFGAIINAVKSDTTSNLLQVPHLVTLDNQEAHSLVGQEIPITTGQALSTNFDNAFRTTQRQNVGIELTVRPQVNSSGTVKLNLRLEVSSIAGPVSSDNSDLILNKREVETVRTVDDGQIAVISGLLDDNERRTIEKIPLLGDIPVLGHLFTSKAKQRSKTNLMIFIRPTILRTAEDSRKLTEQRYGYVRLQQGLQEPGAEPSIDQLVRDYMGAAPPIPSGPTPGSIEDPRIAVPVRTSTMVVRPKK